MGVTLGQALLNFVITADDIQAPWEWPTWQLLTKSIFAPWTLPTEVKEYAPPSAAWTADTPAQVRAFVDNYIGMEDEKARLAFWVKKEDGNSKGRAAYKDWIGRESRKWGINKAVDQILRDAGCSQWQMTRRTVDKATKAVSYTLLPLAKTETKERTSAALSDLFFGADAIRADEDHRSAEVIEFIDDVLTITWDRYRKDVTRTGAIITNETVAVKNIWTTITKEGHKASKDDMLDYVSRAGRLLKALQKFDKQADKAFETEIKDHLDEIRKEGRGGSTKLSKSLKEAIKFLATSNEIAQVTLSIEQILEEMNDINLDALLDGLEDVEIGDLEWEEGIENYRNRTVEQAFAELGITQNSFPSFNQYCDANGCVDPWSAEWDHFLNDPQSVKEAIIPRWHQVIGVRKMVDMFFDQSPLLLMDQVGIGKTMQLVGLIAVLAYFIDYHDKHHKFPGAY
ncbi:hypothetical protein PHLCEN_2v2030, partial [Hermanssonia centrifuga]